MAKNETTTDSPFGMRWLISGVVVLLALACVVFMALRGGGRDSASEPSGAESSPTVAQDGAEADQVSEADQCKTPASSEEGLPSEAPEVTWERHPAGGVVPVSDELGPVSREGDYWRCSAHTPRGALLSGISLLYNFATGDKESAISGPNRDTLFREVQYDSDTEFATPEGFRVILANEDEAIIEYLFSVETANVVQRIPLKWDADRSDWAINADATDFSTHAVTETDGFTSWR